jgi:hypothetical protein
MIDQHDVLIGSAGRLCSPPVDFAGAGVARAERAGRRLVLNWQVAVGQPTTLM